MSAHLLYVEDDDSLSFVTRDHLEMHGFTVTHCADGKAALAEVGRQTFDLCLLDVMLPEMDGFTLATEIRKTNADVPIIFLTAKSMNEDRIHGLRLGGDDYMTKPFNMEELILKIEVFLRRSGANGTASGAELTIGQYSFNYNNLELRLGDDVRRLTQKEADLLRYLARHKNEVVKRSAILEAVWGQDDYFLGRSLDVFISRIRKYLSADSSIRLENVHAVGFCFHVGDGK